MLAMPVRATQGAALTSRRERRRIEFLKIGAGVLVALERGSELAKPVRASAYGAGVSAGADKGGLRRRKRR